MCVSDAVRLSADSPHVPAVLDLIRKSFAFMETRINPPSSMHRLSLTAIKEQCVSGEVWIIGEQPDACVFFTKKPDCIYIGKLAVSKSKRGRGYARQLIDLAAHRARVNGVSALELETRIELDENHETFRRLGFRKTGEGAHAGFCKPTYVIMRKPV
ncbi:GNAT family N-acetyltransferase [Roseibium sp. RKSG952]|nr:GNAT family N-acetyltransferase [Roseibium sp. RKSG952]